MEKETFWKGFYVVTGFLGLILMGFEISIFRQTIINPYIPISIIIVVGFLTFFFNKQHYKKAYRLSGNFFPLMQSLISWGFISCFMFMATNYYLADKETTQYKFVIKEKSSLSGYRGNSEKSIPLVRIDYFLLEKELLFLHTDTDNVNKADSVIVTVRKGGLGFDILADYDVIN